MIFFKKKQSSATRSFLRTSFDFEKTSTVRRMSVPYLHIATFIDSIYLFLFWFSMFSGFLDRICVWHFVCRLRGVARRALSAQEN
jgi:hypothetical protein